MFFSAHLSWNQLNITLNTAIIHIRFRKNRGVIENLPNLAVELTWDTFNKVFDIWDAMAAGNLIPIITGHDGDY